MTCSIERAVDAKLLRDYAELAVAAGINLQPDQRLTITGWRAGVPLECAPFVRRVVDAAYEHGARTVTILWEDEHTRRAQVERGPRSSVAEFDSWQAEAFNGPATDGHALLCVDGHDPRIFDGLPPELASERDEQFGRLLSPFWDSIMRFAVNRSFAACPTPAWASCVFPDLDEDEALRQLWKAVLHAARADTRDPIGEWRRQASDLQARCRYLTARGFSAVRITGPAGKLEVGLAEGHRWCSASITSHEGVPFLSNLPTEEVFTMPHRERVDGIVRGTEPVVIRGEVVEGWELVFCDGRVTSCRADSGEESLKALLASDEGSARLGEIAMAPADSPISETGITFLNTLFDENLSSHLALGASYPMTLTDSDSLDAEARLSRGANTSIEHVDMMFGSREVTIDGVMEAGSIEPLMRNGEWVFDPTAYDGAS